MHPSTPLPKQAVPQQTILRCDNVVTTLCFGCDNVVNLRCDNVKM